jgi:protein involved in polysaccharide export with SLBB domain
MDGRRTGIVQAGRIFATVLMAVAGLVLIAAAGPSNAEPVQIATAASAAAQTEHGALPPVEYRLGAADKVRVIVYSEQSLSGEFDVSGNGKVSLPLIGELQAAGLTVRAFQEEIQNALKDGYLKDPRVSVEVLNYRPYYIMGEISSPGKYPYISDLTVINAVATAGGFTYRANKGTVYIKHIGDQKERGYPLTSTAPVSPGDTIRIGERLF